MTPPGRNAVAPLDEGDACPPSSEDPLQADGWVDLEAYEDASQRTTLVPADMRDILALLAAAERSLAPPPQHGPISTTTHVRPTVPVHALEVSTVPPAARLPTNVGIGAHMPPAAETKADDGIDVAIDVDDGIDVEIDVDDGIDVDVDLDVAIDVGARVSVAQGHAAPTNGPLLPPLGALAHPADERDAEPIPTPPALGTSPYPLDVPPEHDAKTWWQTAKTSPPTRGSEPPRTKASAQAMETLPGLRGDEPFQSVPGHALSPTPPPPAAALSGPPTPVPPPSSRRIPSPTDLLLVDMKDRLAFGDFSGALQLADSLLAIDPEHAEARKGAEVCRERLAALCIARLGSLTSVPRVVVPPDQVRWLSLDHRAGFLLSCIDGMSSVDDLVDVSGMSRLDTLRLLVDLLQQRVIVMG